MAHRDRDEDSICALTTGAGQSGIAVIRVSGTDALSFVRQLCPFIPEEPQSHRVYFGLLKDHRQSFVVDEVLVTYFAHGKSYTGEQTCEISCHGNPVLAAQILSELVSVGCRPAERGEFTYRAFLNDKIDLVQAESVLSLIEGSSKKATRLAIAQLQGQLSQLFEGLEQDIIWILSRIEAEIDFSTEGIESIEIVDKKEIDQKIKNIIGNCNRLIESYRMGRVISEGIKIVLAGPPNAGKSSLLNALIRTDRAIVSSVPGTTRDTVEATYKMKGLTATLVDTAGLRTTSDEIEKLGVERSHRAIQGADLILTVIDATEPEHFDRAAVATPQLLVFNKIDLLNASQKDELQQKFAGQNVAEVSSLTGEGLEKLEQKIANCFTLEVTDEGVVVIHARHENQLKQARRALENAQTALNSQMSLEFICLDLREALSSIGQLLGRGLTEEVISKIFKDFCIGK